MGKTEKQKMLSGELYTAKDPELNAESLKAQKRLARYNASSPEEREGILRVLLGSCGEGVVIRPSFHCDYGYNIHLGRDVFLNFNCVLLDVMPIRIGDGTQIGPAVQIYSADHPRDRGTRLLGLELGSPVDIGKNVWIGGGAIILPGITVGDDAVIGAGAVVTKNVGPRETVIGNPARPVSHKPFSPHNA